ncbi:cell cycle checkpoint control protein Rad9 isoform X1 [Colletes latitarsis]|uniref:cell cycle checkpoint control protein Rad9 isoform X1 n=3 Tax=Colletes latitarsis TaxID=2605962 RepID=UPI0040359A8A
MKCVVPGVNVKILAKAIHALAKIGDEMYIEPQRNALSFRTVNMANSAYADFTVFQNYFSCYVYGDLQEDDALKCKISMRSAMTVFKATNLIDKQVETCHIRLEPDASEILFILKYKNGVTKTHLLPILDCEMLQTAYDKDSASNQLSSQPRVLGGAMHNFHQNLIEITLEVSLQKLLLRNYVDDSSGLSNTTRTQLALGKGEFDQYNIACDTSITFCMREFKAILGFAEFVGVPIGIHFTEAGKPVIFSLKTSSFEANLILSTLSSDTESQTETTLNSKQDKPRKRRTEKKQVSRKPNNKSTSKIKNKSQNINKTLENANAKNIHPYLIEQTNELNRDIFKEKVDEQPSVSNRGLKNDQNKNEDNYLPVEQNTRKESRNAPSCSYNITTSLGKTSTSRKKLVNSVFSTVTKRKSSNDKTDTQQRQDNDISVILEDEVPDSPPPPTKKARLIFQKCFQKTFDPRTLPGYDIILAEDSDGCSSD